MVLRTRIRGAQTADQHYAKRVGMRGHASTGLFGRGAPGGAASTGQRIGCFQRVRGFATASAVAFLGAHPADLLRALAAILYDPGSATRQRTLVWPPAGRQPAYACGAASIWGRLVYTHASARARARARAHTHTHTAGYGQAYSHIKNIRQLAHAGRLVRIRSAGWHIRARLAAHPYCMRRPATRKGPVPALAAEAARADVAHPRALWCWPRSLAQTAAGANAVSCERGRRDAMRLPCHHRGVSTGSYLQPVSCAPSVSGPHSESESPAGSKGSRTPSMSRKTTVCVCVRVRACVRACACVPACVRACVRRAAGSVCEHYRPAPPRLLLFHI